MIRNPLSEAIRDSLATFFAYFPLGIVFGFLFTSELSPLDISSLHESYGICGSHSVCGTWNFCCPGVYYILKQFQKLVLG